MQVKVCGMRDEQNIKKLESLPVNLMGFIFYEKSPRYVGYQNGVALKAGISKVGVFVNASLDFVLSKVESFGLDFVQLHGNENIFYCHALKQNGIKVIKAFSVDEHFSFTNTEAYQYFCDYFLFDTKGKNPGGNGYAFDWDLLKKYKGTTPFLLSGGIDVAAAVSIKAIQHDRLKGVDINSKFEIEPGFKDIEKIKNFIHDLRS